MDPGASTRSWLDELTQALEAEFPELQGQAPYVTVKLASLMLQRLPSGFAGQWVECLSFEERRRLPELVACAEAGADRSIGYASLLEKAVVALSLCPGSDGLEDERARRVVDFFLERLTCALPIQFHRELGERLPAELKQRMSLKSAA